MPPAVPDSLVFVCGPTRFQIDVQLVPVGLDTDGSLQLVNNLSYTPKVGASFTELTKTKPKAKSKPRPKSSAARKPGAGLPPKAQPTGRPQTAGTRSAMLTLQRVEPMSVMKFSSLLALVMWVVIFVAVAIIYFALSKMGVFSSIEHTVGLVTSNKSVSGTNASSWFAASRVLSYTAIFCTINAVLFTALATVGAALYNLLTSLTGGVEVTLKESD